MGAANPNSLASRLRAFFEANPNEMLLLSDICAKFSCTREEARASVVYLRRYGVCYMEFTAIAGERPEGAGTEPRGTF